MNSYSLLVFVHVLLLVFWLGTDIGVFLAAKISERSELSTETRSTVLRLGMILDRLPRSALVLIIPSGLQLAAKMGLLALSTTTLVFVWGIALAWLVILWLGFLNPETSTEKRSQSFNFLMCAVLAVVVTGYAIYFFGSTEVPAWLAAKILLVGLIFISAVVLDAMFKPAVAAFLDIVTYGSTAERDAEYSRAIGPVYLAVLAIYAFVLAAAYFGIAKPYFQ
jgi:hypothetical protein